jgi:hypothetical protein
MESGMRPSDDRTVLQGDTSADWVQSPLRHPPHVYTCRNWPTHSNRRFAFLLPKHSCRLDPRKGGRSTT